MKKIIGTFLLFFAGVLFLQVVIAHVLWTAAIAVSMARPLLIIGACIILMTLGIHLRGDK